MARTRTLAQLITSVRRRTNLENSEFVTDDEITEYINEEYAELVSRLASAEGQPHFVASTPYNVTVGTTVYALPSDFWRILRVTATSDGIERDMEPFMEGERAALSNTQYFAATFLGGPKYRLKADNIEVLPVTKPFTMNLRYIHTCPVLDDAADTVDGYNGYEQAILAGVCAIVREKEETDPSFFERRKARIYASLDAWAAHRDASHPERVTDVVGLVPWGGEEWLP